MTTGSNQPLNSSGGLPGFALRRPVTMIMLFLSLIVLGVITWRNIPVQLFPGGLDPPYLWIWLSYPNASPVENMDRIAIPVEESLWTIKGVKNINTRARTNGCGFYLEFSQSTDMNVAYMAVRDRLERVRPELPDDFRYAYVNRYSETDEPILYFGISVVGSYDDPYRLVDEEVVSRLERIDGVAKVEMWGGDEKIVRVEFLLDRLKVFNIDINSLMRELQSSNFSLAGGQVWDGDRELLIRIDNKIKSLDDLKDMPVRGLDVRLKDIALVTYSSPTPRWIQRIDRRDAIQMGVFKESDANTVEIAEKLVSVLDDIAANPNLSGLDFNILFDQGKYITTSLSDLQTSGMWGAIFAICVLFFFLRRVRMTLFITLAIPFSLMITIVILYFMGWSLNIITLSGLMICVGLVVDNAIVVVENIQSFKGKGKSSRDAAVQGTSEVGLAITLATLTTIVVFLPLMLMGSDRTLTFFMLRIGLPVIFALLGSLFVALLFIPLAVNHFALKGSSKPNPLINKGSIQIGKTVAWVLEHRTDTIIILMLILLSTGIPMSKVVSTDEEEGNINDFQLRFAFPSYFSLEREDSVLTAYEDYLYENSEKYDIKTVVTGFRRGFGRMRVFLNEKPSHFWLFDGFERFARKLKLYKPSTLSRKEIIEDIKEQLKPPPGVEMFTSWRQGRGEEHAVYVSVFGENTERLLSIVEDAKNRLNQLEGVITIETDLETSADEVQITFNSESTARLGVDPAATSYGLNALIRGVRLPDINFYGHEISAQAELLESDRSTLSQVMNLPAAGFGSRSLRLDDVASVGYNRGIGEISRENSRTRIRIKIVTTEENLDKLSRHISTAMTGLSLPAGYEWGKGQRFQTVEDASKERSQAWLLAITFVLLLMGALFESFFLPWAVIITVPFSFFGVWWMLFVTQTQFGIMAGIGAVILIGVVVNNAIVLVDKVNRLREEGMPRDLALRAGAELRFQPIMLTALTTIMGLVPMAMGSTNLIGIPYAPMGRAIIGGMLTATITTPIVVPLAYSLIDDLQIWMRAWLQSFKVKNA